MALILPNVFELDKPQHSEDSSPPLSYKVSWWSIEILLHNPAYRQTLVKYFLSGGDYIQLKYRQYYIYIAAYL